MVSETMSLSGRIEGGYDAVVIGANVDGLAAACYLARHKLRTILIDANVEVGGAIKKRPFGDGAEAIDGPLLATHLDPAMIEDLELYRFGLEYAARRLESVYLFENGETLSFDGDLVRTGADLETQDPGVSGFINSLLSDGANLRRYTQDSLSAIKHSNQKGKTQSPDGMIKPADSLFNIVNDHLSDRQLRSVFACEGALSAGVPLHEPFSASALAHRFAGEVAGLAGACAYPAGGMTTVIEALRRAVQAAGVDIRTLSDIQSILIERDGVAGISLGKGGQVRAPIVISAVDAHTTFIDYIGAGYLDAGFQQAVMAKPPSYMSARMNVTLKGAPSDEVTRALMRKRLVLALSPATLRESFIAARQGDIPGAVMVEAIFPENLSDQASASSAIIADTEPMITAHAHPFPFIADPTPQERTQVTQAILKALSAFIPGLDNKVERHDVRFPSDFMDSGLAQHSMLSAKPSIAAQLALAKVTSGADEIRGLYFCGREARLGDDVCGMAARVAAKRALTDVRNGKFST